MRATLFDYGAGNLHSLEKAIALAGFVTHVTADATTALDTDVLVLPGVGAFAYAAERICAARNEWCAAIESGLPTLGICLGMQLLFERSEEGPGEGLGILAGEVTRLRASRLPHIGWNAVVTSDNAAPATTMYYANGFACRARNDADVTAWTTHEGDRFPAIVRRGNTIGVQFHPEKSSIAGVTLLGELLREVTR